MIDNFQTMREQVPKFSVPADENASRKLVSNGSVPQQAIFKVLALIQQCPLLTGNELGPDQFRDRVAYASAYGPVSDEVDAFSTALKHSVLTALSEVGRATLTVYEVVKRESKRPESADLRPHVADLKRLLSGRFGGRSKAARTHQAPASSSASASSQPAVETGASASGSTGSVVTSQAPKQQ